MVITVFPKKRSGPATKEGGTDPDVCRSGSNGVFHIAGHAHGQGIPLLPLLR
jgi:hypothetical protein